MIKSHKYNGIGMYQTSSNNVITKNTLSNNEYCGINAPDSRYCNVTQNNISNNNVGIRIPDDSYKNQVFDNTMSNNNKNLEKVGQLPGFEYLFLLTAILCILFIMKRKIKR